MSLEQDTELKTSDIVASLSISSGPESNFLDAISTKVYPHVKAFQPNVSYKQIRETAEGFRGVKVRKYAHIFLYRALIDPPLVTAGKAVVEVVTGDTKPPFLSFLNRFKKPLKILGIQL